MIILGPKTAILGPQFCRILVLGPHFWGSGGAQAPEAPLDLPLSFHISIPTLWSRSILGQECTLGQVDFIISEAHFTNNFP